MFRNGTSTAVAIPAGSFDDTARSRLDLRAFIDDLGNAIVGWRVGVIVSGDRYGRAWQGLGVLVIYFLVCFLLPSASVTTSLADARASRCAVFFAK